MQHDEVIWSIINHGFCSFKSKVAKESTFCRNEYNVTGLCLRSACPLANSQYATIREEDGVCYLYMKTIERAHTPKNMWEKLRLPANYTKALEIVSQQLEHFPKYLVHRNKQRLTKIHQMLIRMRKLRLRAGPKIVTINTKVEQREKGRERKALRAADLDKAIEKELLERLQQVTDSEIYNYPERQYNKMLTKASNKFRAENGEEIEDPDVEEEVEEEDGESLAKTSQRSVHNDEDEVEEEEEEEEPEYNVEYVEDFDESDDEEVDLEDAADVINTTSFYSKSAASKSSVGAKRKMNSKSSSSKFDESDKRNKKARKKGPRVEIEYEDEVETSRERSTEGMDFNF